VYRYPCRYDNAEFHQQLAKFIENDLLTNYYKDLNENHNRFYVDIVDGKIQFVDKNKFQDKERLYIKYHDPNDDKLNSNSQIEFEDSKDDCREVKDLKDDIENN